MAIFVNREYYHSILDNALDKVEEGESFLPVFTQMVAQAGAAFEPIPECDYEVEVTSESRA